MPHPSYEIDDPALANNNGTAERYNSDDDGVERDFGTGLTSLPPSDVPIPSSPITLHTSQENTNTIRPFPLLHMMLSPSFAAIRDMDNEPSRSI